MIREKERALKDLLNLLDDAFDGLDFTEEIQKFEEKYSNKVGFQIRAQIGHGLSGLVVRIKLF